MQEAVTRLSGQDFLRLFCRNTGKLKEKRLVVSVPTFGAGARKTHAVGWRQ